MHPLAKLDHNYVWHPFTQMRDWLKREPIIISEGRGATLRDVHGHEYLDANSSIWTNLHGHNHSGIKAAIRRQMNRIAHSSALGLANEPASLLAEKLVQASNPQIERDAVGSSAKHHEHKHLRPALAKVFFSDDGSTAMEVALKLAYEFARRSRHSKRPRFLGLGRAYHGDTIGCVSLGHIDLFHKNYSGLLFKTDYAAAPYCYRCCFNRAKPERTDGRDYRKCGWECLDVLDKKFRTRKRKGEAYSAFVFEPLIQGAAGMVPQPIGWLGRAAEIARHYGALLIADEVMTGFGRTGGHPGTVGKSLGGGQPALHNPRFLSSPPLFACHQEQVQPDFLAVAKGLTGGYLPMAATITTGPVFDAFLGEFRDFKTFFHGHSFTGNQLGAAAALASLDALQRRDSIQARHRLQQDLQLELPKLWRLPIVGDIRQVGLIAGVELVKTWRTRQAFDLGQRVGMRVCEAMARRGVLTRPIGDVIVLMPPYCATSAQVVQMVQVLAEAIEEVASHTCRQPKA